MNKKTIIRIGIITFLVAILLAFILNMLFKVKTDGFFSAEWEAGDALNYVASIFGAVGTIVLGYIAYKQNNKLQELEKNNYIANNNALLLMNEIHINEKAKILVNWNDHLEQIVVDSSATDECNNIGYEFIFEATGIGNAIPSLLHINECKVCCSDKEGTSMSSYLFGKNYSNVYSRVAIHKDNKIKFKMSYIIDRNKKMEFENAIKENSYNVIVEITFNIITDKNVITKCKCRSYCYGQNYNNNIIWVDKEPMVFFYGHEIVNPKDIIISGDESKIV